MEDDEELPALISPSILSPLSVMSQHYTNPYSSSFFSRVVLQTINFVYLQPTTNIAVSTLCFPTTITYTRKRKLSTKIKRKGMVTL